MKALFIGDIVGSLGRRAVRQFLESQGNQYDFVMANGENSAGGKGLTGKCARSMFEAGVNALTGGNHIWRNRDVMQIIDDPRVVRPANYPVGAETAGHGYTILDSAMGPAVGIVNLLGRTFMNHHEDPYVWAEALVEDIRRETPIIFVDFHAEATSEKLAMFRILDGLVTAVIGTHTHVQTADEQVSAAGTAYLTDVGMTGPHDSILGVKTELILRQLRTGLPVRHELATGDVRLSAVAIDVDPETGRATGIERISVAMDG